MAVPTPFATIPAIRLLSEPAPPFGGPALICWLRFRGAAAFDRPKSTRRRIDALDFDVAGSIAQALPQDRRGGAERGRPYAPR